MWDNFEALFHSFLEYFDVNVEDTETRMRNGYNCVNGITHLPLQHRHRHGTQLLALPPRHRFLEGSGVSNLLYLPFRHLHASSPSRKQCFRSAYQQPSIHESSARPASVVRLLVETPGIYEWLLGLRLPPSSIFRRRCRWLVLRVPMCDYLNHTNLPRFIMFFQFLIHLFLVSQS